MIALALSSGLLAGFVFLCLVHFQPGDFLATFRFHSTRYTLMKATATRRLVVFAIEHLRILNWPLLLIPLGLLLFLLRKPKDNLTKAGICTMAAFPLAAAAGLVAIGAMWWPILAMLFLGAAALKIVSARWRTGLTTAIIAMLLVANRRDFIAMAGILSGKISADLGEESAAALAVRPSRESGLLIDSWIARYLYDYRLPQGALDLQFGAPFPGWLPGCTPLPPTKGPEFRTGDVFLAGPRVVEHLINFTYLDERDIAKWRPFGISAFASEKNPRRVYVIPAESCKGRRKPPLT